MEGAASWVTPLLILHGVGLLLVSTASRYEAVHAKIHALLAEFSPEAAGCAIHVAQRARIFRNAMFSLYASACALGSAGLVGALTYWLFDRAHWAALGLTMIGVASLVIAAALLMRESALSLKIVESHRDTLMRDLDQEDSDGENSRAPLAS